MAMDTIITHDNVVTEDPPFRLAMAADWRINEA